MPKDTWLEGNSQRAKRERAAVLKQLEENKGHIDPASDHAYRMLITAPGLGNAARITNWGGKETNDGSVVSIVRAAPEVPESRQLRDPFTTFYVQGIALEPPLPPERLLNLTEDNALHSACLMAKATDSCGRGWEFKPKEGKENDQELIESETPIQLKEAVAKFCPELTFSQLLYQAAWEMDAIGWSVWEIVRMYRRGYKGNQYLPIGAIYPIPAHTVRATLDPRKWVQIRAGRVRYFKKFGAKCDINNETGSIYEWGGRGAESVGDLGELYLASELIIFKTYTPRSIWYGLPRWVSAIATVAELTAIREFNVSWFASGGQTDYAMHFSAQDIDVAKNMVAEARQQLLENQGRGHTILMTAGSEDTEVAVNKLGELLREGHFRFRRGDLAKEVLIAHNTPPYRIGWAETGSLAGNAAKEMLEAYKFGAIEPVQEVFEEGLERTLFNPDLGGLNPGDFCFRLHDLEMMDMQFTTDRTLRSVQFGVLTPNQGREELGWDPDDEHPELDKYYHNGQEIGAEPAADPFGGFGGGGGAFGEEELAPEEEAAAAEQEGVSPEALRAALGAMKSRARRRHPYAKIMGVIERFESTLKAALEGDVTSPPKERAGRGRKKPAVSDVHPVDSGNEGLGRPSSV